MISTIVMFVLTFAVLGLLLGYASSYDAVDGATLQLATDKEEYDGEPVVFTVRNAGSEALVFPDSALGIEIRNLDSGDRFSIIAAQVLTTVEAGETRDIQWQDASDAPAGNYSATVSTAGGSAPAASAEVNFKIN